MSGADLDEVLYNKPGHLIRRLQQIAVTIFLEETEALDITPVQYAALTAIRAYPGIDQLRLAQAIGFDRTTIGGVIERLEGKGLLQRKIGAADRRARLLYMTAAGRRHLAAARPGAERAQDRILDALAPAERRRFVAMLAQLVRINNGTSRAPLTPPAASR